MPPLFTHPYVKWPLIGFAGFIGLTILIAALLFIRTLFSGYGMLDGYSNNSFFKYTTEDMAMAEPAFMGRSLATNEMTIDVVEDYYEPPYISEPTGTISTLEQYETTNYYMNGSIKSFDETCGMLEQMKAEERYIFKNLNSDLNYCSATFFAAPEAVDSAIALFSNIAGVTISRNTQSVSKHREQLLSQQDIITEQLSVVTATLTEAKTAYDDIALFARQSGDAIAYSTAIDTKLRQIEQLSQRQINLTSQLDRIAQQSADLQEHIGMVEISASFSRAYQIDTGRDTYAWAEAWQQLKDAWTQTGIGFTAYVGIFILYAIQAVFYFFIILLVARFGWKGIKRVWKM